MANNDNYAEIKKLSFCFENIVPHIGYDTSNDPYTGSLLEAEYIYILIFVLLCVLAEDCFLSWIYEPNRQDGETARNQAIRIWCEEWKVPEQISEACTNHEEGTNYSPSWAGEWQD